MLYTIDNTATIPGTNIYIPKIQLIRFVEKWVGKKASADTNSVTFDESTLLM